MELCACSRWSPSHSIINEGKRIGMPNWSSDSELLSSHAPLNPGHMQSHSRASTSSHGAHVRAPGVVQEGHGGAPSMMEERAAAAAFFLRVRTKGAIFYFFRSFFSYSKPPSARTLHACSVRYRQRMATSLHAVRRSLGQNAKKGYESVLTTRERAREREIIQ